MAYVKKSDQAADDRKIVALYSCFYRVSDRQGFSTVPEERIDGVLQTYSTR